HFAAPPVLMVAGAWGWDTAYMFTHFGWKALIGIIVATVTYYLVFRREFVALAQARAAAVAAGLTRTGSEALPAWITVIQLGFMGFTVMVAHYPPLFIGGFLFFLAFSQATA
ncbi:MAG: putative Na+/H+ antiporter, partial [Opitutus sp.]